MNKKNENNNLSSQEDEYLRKLEESISGKNGDSVYILPEREIKRRKQLEILRKQELEEQQKTFPPQDKEPHTIPIEWAVGDAQEPTAKVEVKRPDVPVNETVRQESVPVETETPSPQVSEIPKTPPAASREIPSTIMHPPLFEIGTILRLEDGSIGIYKGSISGKEYHMIYHLRPDGLVEPQGIYIYAYRCEPFGHVPDDVLQEIQRTMRWERDRIISHLTSDEKSRLIPLLSPTSGQRMVGETPHKKRSLERGRILRIRMGNRVWEAVNWGSNELGQIVAHNTSGKWALMHLNLGRFGDSLEYGELLSPEEIRDINKALSESITFGE